MPTNRTLGAVTPGTEPARWAPERSRYLDLLRTAALARVVLYHVTGWLWLSLLVPAMGLMFGIGGSLMAASLDRTGWRAIARRLRRLLLPFWAFGAVTLVLLFSTGQGRLPTGALDWGEVVWWVLPLRVPAAGGPWAWAFTIGLWYIVTYLWLVLLSPILLRVFRRWPWPSIGVATALPVGMYLAGVHVGYFAAAYLSCWLLGFAHHDRLLHRVPLRWYGCLVAILAGAGGTWIMMAVVSDADVDVNYIAGGSTLWSMAWVAALLRLQPRLRRLANPSPVGRALRLVNARAVTIYLWQIPASLAVTALLAPVLPFHSAAHLGLRLTGVCLLTAVAVLLFGWIEDVAARRTPGLLGPGPGRRAPRSRQPARLPETVRSVGSPRPTTPAASSGRGRSGS